MNTYSIDCDPEERQEMLRVRIGDKIRCLLRLPLVRPAEVTGCLRLCRRGGTFSYHRFFVPWISRVSTIYIRRSEFSDSDMRLFRKFSGLVAADFGDTRLTDNGLSSLFASSKTLEYLFLWGTNVGSGVVHFVERMPALKMLNISTPFVDHDTFELVCDRVPNCLVTHAEFGFKFRGLEGDAATQAWMSDAR